MNITRREAQILPGHMVAALFQFHHSPATVTSLPTSFLCRIKQLIRFLIVWAFLGPMPLSITFTTYFSPTTITLPVLATVFLVNL